MLSMFAKKSTKNFYQKRLSKMEILTDIMAIIGWGFFGGIFHGLAFTFRRHELDEAESYSLPTYIVSFGLIAASFVL